MLGPTGTWVTRPRDLSLAFALPDKSGIYDDFRFVVDGVDLAPQLRPKDGMVATTVPVKPGQTVCSKWATARAACRNGFTGLAPTWGSSKTST